MPQPTKPTVDPPDGSAPGTGQFQKDDKVVKSECLPVPDVTADFHINQNTEILLTMLRDLWEFIGPVILSGFTWTKLGVASWRLEGPGRLVFDGYDFSYPSDTDFSLTYGGTAKQIRLRIIEKQLTFESDPDIIGFQPPGYDVTRSGSNQYRWETEFVTTEVSDPTPTPNPANAELRIIDIMLIELDTDDTVLDELESILDGNLVKTLAALIDDTDTAHAAMSIDVDASPDWHDGTPNGAEDLQSRLDGMISDLVADSGANLLGADASTNWKDGKVNPAGSVQDKSDNIIIDLISEAADHSGADRIGASAKSDSPESLSAGSIASQLTALLDYINTKGHIAVANAWTALQSFAGGGSSFGAFLIGGQSEPSSPSDGEVWRLSTGALTIKAKLGTSNRKIVESKQLRTVMVGLSRGVAYGNWNKYFDPEGSYYYTYRIQLNTSPYWVVFPINGHIPQGATLTRAQIAAYTYIETTQTNRMLLQIRKVEFSSGTDSLVAEGYATSFTGDQFFGPTCSEVFNSEDFEYYVRVRCSLANNGSNESIKRGLELRLTDGDYTAIP